MALIFRTHNLNRARKRLERVSSRQKEFQINFVREQQRNQRFRTTPHIVRGVKEHHGSKGLLHRAYHLKFRVKGDKSSFTRAVNNFEPHTKGGKFVQTSAKATNFIVHDVAQTAVDVSLAGETIGLKSSETAVRELKNHYQQKYSHEATDDYHKGILFSGRLVFDAVNGTRQHFRLKKQYQLESAKSDVKTAEYREFQKEYKIKFRKYKNQKFEIKKLKNEKKFKTAEMKNQQKIAKFSKQNLSAVNPVNYSVTRMTASAWQKAVNEDSDNDFMRAADEIKNRVASSVAQNFTPQAKLQREQKKRDKIADKKAKTHSRLIQQEQRLHERNQPRPQRRNRIRPQKSVGDKIKENIKEIFHFVKNVYVKEVGAFFGTIAIPILVFFLIFAFLMMIFSSIISGGGFTLGTYAAQDYDLSQAEKYYTEIAWNFNENLLLVGDSDNWKKGLKKFDVDTKNMKDKPDNWYFGKSEVYDWTPDYDFDTYKLWSFLCAYYYDFDSENGDIKYWKFAESTKDLLDELFQSEYEFVYWYDNTSHWEYRYQFESNGYYSISGSGVSGSYGYIDVSYPNALPVQNVTDGNTLYYDLNNGEILNYNDDYSATGWYLKNQYTDDYDASGAKYEGWYQNGEECSYGIYENNVLKIPCPYVIPENSWISVLKMYDWKTDCHLYYSVKQKDTFENLILNKLKNMSHADERIDYYNLLLSEDMYGNHQTLKNIFDGETIKNYTFLNGYGYDVQNWNEKHCKINNLHEGIDISYSANGNLYAPFDCKIADIGENSIVLRKEDVIYWYDGNGGTKRDTEVYLTNAVLTDGLKEGDTIKSGELFAKLTNYQHCDNFENPMSDYVHVKVRIDTDGFGWNDIDPRLVFY